MSLREFKERRRQFINNTPAHLLLIYTFALLIFISSILLWMPFSQEEGGHTGYLDCLFTAASAACVTGLITVDFPASFNTLGEFITLLTIQLGGLGVMTFAAVSFRILGSQLSLSTQAIVSDSFFQKDAAFEFRKTFNYIFGIVFTVEVIGAALLFWDRLETDSVPVALWNGIFHSVSAFCNAGFSLWSNSLAGQNNFFLCIIMLLIVAGGMGHIVLVEIFNLARKLTRKNSAQDIKYLSYNTRVCILLTLILVLAGSIILYIFGFGQENQVMNAVFQSVTARTAGFSTISQTLLSRPEALIMILLMFIGGCPGSCAGGIKTTTFAIWFSEIKSKMRNKPETTLLGRRVPEIIINRAYQLIALALIWNAAGILILCLCEKHALLDLVYEQISAFGTVGLSRDLTPQLSAAGKIWIILTMFMGRLGPLTIALTVSRRRQPKIFHPEGRIMIG